MQEQNGATRGKNFVSRNLIQPNRDRKGATANSRFRNRIISKFHPLTEFTLRNKIILTISAVMGKPVRIRRGPATVMGTDGTTK